MTFDQEPARALPCATGLKTGGLRTWAAGRPGLFRAGWVPAVLVLLAGWGTAPLGGAVQRVINQASGEYVDPVSAITYPLLSNQVEVWLADSPGLLLEADRWAEGGPGSAFTLSHRLTNTGTARDEFALGVEHLREGDFFLENVNLYWDANGNGLLDSGEILIATAGAAAPRATFNAPNRIALVPGESIELIVVGRIPATAREGMRGRIRVSAFSPTTGVAGENTDTVVARTVPARLSKSVSPHQARRHEEVHWTVNAFVFSPLAPIPVTVDGTNLRKVILRDTIPVNTTFSRFGATHGALPLYHLHGNPPQVYQSAPPEDLTQVDAIAWAFSEVKQAQVMGVSFYTTVNPAASGRIPNTATLYYSEEETVELLASNQVEVTLPLYEPVIQYFTNDRFERLAPLTRLGAGLFLQAEAAACNLDPLAVEEVTITILSRQTGDEESFLARETAPNSGVFRILPAVPTADARSADPARLNGTLETVTGDVLLATIRDCGGILATTSIQVDPFGVVFDSRTNLPVAGARVTLIDLSGEGNGGRPGQAAQVLAIDYETPAPSTVVTGEDGVFFFPLVARSTYRVQVDPPADYRFPSLVPRGLLDPSRLILLPASYGGEFRITDALGLSVFDLPLDRASAPGFNLEKSVSRPVAEIGDSVIYTLEVRNATGAVLRSVQVDDYLPHGFRYEPGSTRLEGSSVAAADPEGGAGPHLRFSLGHLEPQATVKVRYRVRLGPGAARGTGINRAQAISLGPPLLTSNQATARVRVEEGVFSDRGIIFGRVFVDLDGDRLPSPGDLGLPGVRIYLEDGTHAVTDGEGKYSIYGQRPVAHTVKLDTFTLPPGSELVAIDSRNAGDPESRFADLKHGELHKANFALLPNETTLREVERRRQASPFTPEYQSALERTFEADGRRPAVSDPKALPASGTLEGRTSSGLTWQPLLPPGTLTAGNSRLPSAAGTAQPAVDLSILAGHLTDPSPGFLDLADGDTLPMAMTDVRLKGAAGTTFRLSVNGVPIPDRRIGQALENPATQVRLVEYIGLTLQPGPNHIVFTQMDPFGNERGGQSVTVYAPDSLARIRLEFDPPNPVADGLTPLLVVVHLEDKEGRPVTTRVPLTLESDYGTWAVEDLNPNEPGIQAFLTGGEGAYPLLPTDSASTARISVSSGILKSERSMRFLPQMRPFVVSGIAEARAQRGRGDSAPGEGGAASSDRGSPFEDTLQEIATFRDGSVTGRVAGFAKGEVASGWLLTASYDSDKERDGNLFRDIDPEAFYPVYGDESVRGYDAQSTSKLYARMENKMGYLQWGDFTTQGTASGSSAATDVRSLGAYNRSLTGASARYETDRVSARAWAAQTASRRVVIELPGNGTSGPFAVTPAGNGLRNSETVEILTRDRNQPSLILNATPLTRYTDYEFEPFSGRILLRAPLPSTDSNFNPLSLRVSFELEAEGGDSFWVWGLDAQVRILPWWEVGASHAQDHNPLEDYTLSSVNSTLRLGEGTYLLVEAARSEHLQDGTGLAGRAEWRHQSARTEARVHAGRAEESFRNETALLSAGRVEAGYEVTHQLGGGYQVRGEGIYSEDLSSTGNRVGARVDLSKSLPGNLTLTVGARASEESAQPASSDTAATPGTTPNSVRSLRLRLDAPMPGVPSATIFGEVENDVRESDRRIVAVGGDYQVKPKTRLYARHEFIDSLGGEFQINSTQQNNRTLVGVESEYWRNASLFNEYRVRDSLSARESEAATGLRNRWTLSHGLDLNTTFERVTPFDGTEERKSTAATAAIAYTAPEDWKASMRAEARFAHQSDSFLHSLGYARKLNPNWTFLTRTIYYRLDSSSPEGQDQVQARLLTGLAYRPIRHDTWNALLRYEIKYEDGSLDFQDDLRRLAHIGSISWNWQPVLPFTLSSRYAFKYVDERRPLGSSQYTGHLLGLRALFDLTRRIDTGLSGSLFFDGSSSRFHYALGPEIGLNLKKQMRLALGWNFFGYHDRDFSDLAYSRRGLFLSFRLKFTENFFRDLWGADRERPDHHP